MIRRYIANLSTNILKRTCTAIAAIALTTVGCSPPKPPNTAATSSAIASSSVLTQPPTSVLAKNPNKRQKSISVPSCAQNDPFGDSVNFATKAANLAQSANSKQEWDEVAAQWVQAVAWMQAVPPGSPRRAFAEKKVTEYMKNLLYAQQQAGASRSPASNVSFSSDLLDEQLELYLSYVAAVGPPDVLIVGSSRALQGVDPKQLKQSLAANGSPGLKVFNFSVNGATAQVVDFQLRRLLKPDHLPQMIVWADGVRAFNSGRDDRTFNSIVDSEGSQLLAAGVRPKLPSGEPNVTPQCYRFPQSCNTDGDGIFRRAQADRGGQDAQPLLPTIQFTSSGTGILPVAQNAVSQTTVAIRQVSQLADAIDSNGFMSMSGSYNPDTYYRQRPYVSGKYDRDYEDFNLGGKQATAFNSVVAFTKTRKIPLIFVNLPLTDDYLDPTRRWAEQQFRQRMQQLSRQKGFAFRDLSQRWPNRNDYFLDPSHLNRFGAIAVSRILASDTSIIWPQPKSRITDG
ncbi:MAG: hypothetical protein JGK17_01850 [Microcoleus sp. PH2017_10_PVI_O_A]|uniref:hypothetical protein n=1 Tax=unclassified Microcoleus TaxID=2642155 RepID=UPI001D665754|nr:MULTISPECIES: hypothetical protein [unclassified Microcoleus]TAE82710.1 MAG: hypothetical protein EAZ83_11730 [Oscillatoriales cyanobacterium]MCC3404358.1 hypothetical protein [Microcoleus sp. PH2017_10_PVI_O_A]MCC3458448.1 hypothetical protein [Microcoleus sp. PH2017_11_PCY_U_A]MCC3477292.1 hypothetical protein [Microcoleus sp. PH2017_12_PCY_D_A]MCC3530479.1 hypothetical protein [Microcoleus sp. PH2017_21_RUC_O_A]